MTDALHLAFAHAHGLTADELLTHKPAVAEVIRWANQQRKEFRALHGTTSPELFDRRSTVATPVLSEAGLPVFTAWLSAKYATVRA